MKTIEKELREIDKLISEVSLNRRDRDIVEDSWNTIITRINVGEASIAELERRNINEQKESSEEKE